MPRTRDNPNRRVEHCMGTVFSLVVADPGDWHQALVEALAWLHHVDAVFSTYLSGSAISRLRRGEDVPDPLVDEVLALCTHYEQVTGGAFTADLPGGLDPSGLVKGWAVERASDILRRHGSSNHAINGGGDLQLAGEPAPGRPWRVGISHPLRRGEVVATVEGRDFAVATSGTNERGLHLVDPASGRPAQALASVTATGPRLTLVDVAATAAFVKGPHAVGWLRRQGLGGVVVELDGTVHHV